MNTSFCRLINFLNMFPKLFLLANINSRATTLTSDLLYRLNLLPFFAKSILQLCTNSSNYFIDPFNILPIKLWIATMFFSSSSRFNTVDVWERCCGWRKLCSAELHCYDWGWAALNILEFSWSGDLQWSRHLDLPHWQQGQHADHLQCGPQALGRVHMHSKEPGGLKIWNGNVKSKWYERL